MFAHKVIIVAGGIWITSCTLIGLWMTHVILTPSPIDITRQSVKYGTDRNIALSRITGYFDHDECPYDFQPPTIFDLFYYGKPGREPDLIMEMESKLMNGSYEVTLIGTIDGVDSLRVLYGGRCVDMHKFSTP